MKTDHTSSDFKKLLDKLQQESWQLELIISGFAIFGLFQLTEPLFQEIFISSNNGLFFKTELLKIVFLAIRILSIALIIHVFLRGLWIGALGLRYVSGEINFSQLNYTKKFDSYLRRKVGTFDAYIFKLENLCSTLYALAFLMVFYLLAFFLVYLLLAGFMTVLLSNLTKDSSEFAGWIIIGIIIIFALLCFVVFIDFITLGLLKKNKITAKFYFPIYRLFSVLTLSFLYRPLVYNFLDQKYARWVAMLAMPAYLIYFAIFSNLNFQHSNYFTDINYASPYTANGSYLDEINIKKLSDATAFLESKIIETKYLKVFMLFNENIEEVVFAKDSTLILEKDSRGYVFSDDKKEIKLSGQKQYLEALNGSYTIKVDTLTFTSDFLHTTLKNEMAGFMQLVNLNYIKEGKHIMYLLGPRTFSKGPSLIINNKRLVGKTAVDFKTQDTLATIPFWYYPNTGVNKMVAEKDSL